MLTARAASAACVAVVASALLAVPVAAQAADELAPVMMVLDASGSMKEPAAGGSTKMATAKDAVHTLVGQLPEQAQLGLAVYGTGTDSSAAAKKEGCRDVRVVHDVGPLDRSALNTAVDAVEPRGYTPVGESLRAAAAALPAQGPRSIVLVSDGEDTCAPPDPCEVAGQLAKQGVDMRIHAVGFDVDDTARQQLACIAQATGGEYVDARDAGSLIRALNRIGQRALRSYAPVGTPVTGTKRPDGAPALRPGAYLDRIGPDESRFYTVDVPAGYTLYASASAVLADGGDYLVHVGRHDRDGRGDCSGTATAIKTEGPVASTALRWTAPGSGSDPCDRPGRQHLRVSLDAVSQGDDVSALELLIGLEPPVTGESGPPGTTDPVRFTPSSQPAEPAVGGGSFAAATPLDGSGAYTDTVLAGEMVFYRVRLDWGTGLAYRLRLGEQDGIGGLFVKTAWYNPARAEQQSDSTAYDGRKHTVPDAAGTLGGPPVRYRNRELTGTEVGPGVDLAGWYYISVLVDQTYEPKAVPLTIEVSVSGDTRPGPRYDGDTDTDPFGAQDGGPSRRPTPIAAAATDGLWSTIADAGPLLWVGALLLALLGITATGLLVLRRRRTP